MCVTFRLRYPCCQSHRPRFDRDATIAGLLDSATGLDENKGSLPPPDEFKVHFCQQLGIEQRAVFGAARIIDAVAGTKVIKPVSPAGVPASCQHQRVDKPLTLDQ